MESVTYFVALPFDRDANGILVAGEPREQRSAEAAETAARRMAKTAAGALAFSRTGDPVRGEFEEAVLLKTYGDVPEAPLQAI